MGKRAIKTVAPDIQVSANDRRQAPRKGRTFGSRRGQKLEMGLTRTELVVQFQGKVKIMAMQLAKSLGADHEVDELYSMGLVGLIDAANKFDPQRGVQFNTYAEFRIRGAIIDGLRAQDWVPRSARERMKNLRVATEAVEARTGKPATELDLSAQMEMSLPQFRQMMENLGSQSLVNIDDLPENVVLNSGDGETTNPFREAVRSEAKVVVERLIQTLPERQRMVLQFIYFRGLTANEVAEILDLSAARISQIHFEALAMMRTAAKPSGFRTDNLLVALMDE